MKHLLNDLSNEDKKSIREQHTGGMKVMTENFRKLLNSKHGDAKPLVLEQESNNDRYNAAGYKKVNDINLPNGSYVGNPPGVEKVASPANLYYVSDLHIYDKSGKSTGYLISLENPSRSGYENADVVITDKKSDMPGTYFFKDLGYKPTEQSQTNAPQNTKTLTNKVASEGIKNVTSQMMSDPPFPGEYSGYGFGGVFGGINYMWDCNGVEGMSGVRGMVDGIVLTETIENMLSYQDAEITDGKPGSPCVGFHSDQVKFIIYTSIDGKSKCKNY